MKATLIPLSVCLLAAFPARAQYTQLSPFSGAPFADRTLQQAMTVEVLQANGAGTAVGAAYFAGEDGTYAYFVTAYSVVANPAKGVQPSACLRRADPQWAANAEVLNRFTKDLAVLRVPVAHAPRDLATPTAAQAQAEMPLFAVRPAAPDARGSVVKETIAPGDASGFTTTYTSLSEKGPAPGAPLLDSQGGWIGLHTAATPARGLALASAAIIRQLRDWGLQLKNLNETLSKDTEGLKSPDLVVRTDAARRLGELGARLAYQQAVINALQGFVSERTAIPQKIEGASPEEQPKPPTGMDASVQEALSALTSHDWFKEIKLASVQTLGLPGLPGFAPRAGGPCTGLGNGLSLVDMQLDGALLANARLAGTRMSGAVLDRATLTGAQLRRACVAEAKMREVRARGADFREVDASGIRLGRGDLAGANFAGAGLEKASLEDADLSGADFTDSVLGEAVLERSNLRTAKFAGADLRRASLKGAHLEGADLRMAMNVAQEQLDGALGDDATRIPPRLRRPVAWPRASAAQDAAGVAAALDELDVQRSMTAKLQAERKPGEKETGAAYFVARGPNAAYMVTAWHVVSDGAGGVVPRATVTLPGREPIQGKVFQKFDPDLDLAVVVLLERAFPPSLFTAPAADPGDGKPFLVVGGDGSKLTGKVKPDAAAKPDDPKFSTEFSEERDMNGYSGAPLLAPDGSWLGMHTKSGAAGTALKSKRILAMLRQWGLAPVTSAEILAAEEKRLEAGPAEQVEAMAAMDRLAAAVPGYRDRVLDTLTGFLKRTAAWDAESDRRPRPTVATQAALDVIGRRTWARDKDEPFDRAVSPFKSPDLSHLDLRGADLEDAWLNFVDLSDSHLEMGRLTRVHLQKADLRGAHFGGADLTSAWMREAVAESAAFAGAALTGATLELASLNGADLGQANLDRAYLMGADLSNASLYYTEIRNTSFEEVDLEDATFTNAHVEGTSFIRALHLTQAQLDSTLGDSSTRISASRKRPSSWTK